MKNGSPCSSDDQRPIGRVSKTTPEYEGGRLPVVRLIALSRDMIYLEQSEAPSLPAASGYDTPFISWLTEGSRPDQVAQRLIDLRFCGIRRARPRFLLHYHEEINGQALSVYLSQWTSQSLASCSSTVFRRVADGGPSTILLQRSRRVTSLATCAPNTLT